jgi:FKBP-type peptidyl-prolyl cis-trans isomerase FklB
MFSLRSVFLFFAFFVASVAAGTNSEGLAFLAKKTTEEGVVTLPSGLLYKELVAGVGKTPTADSPCACHYSGTLIDGTEFDSSYKRGQPTTFAPNQVIKVSFMLLTLNEKPSFSSLSHLLHFSIF